MAEIQAEKDQLRAEYAVSIRRLERSLEQHRAKLTSQLAELGRKTDEIGRLKAELGEKAAAIAALETREKALQEQLNAAHQELAARTDALQEAQRAVAAHRTETTEPLGAPNEQTVAAAGRIEIVALETQIEAFKEQVATLEREVKEQERKLAEQARERERLRAELEAARRTEAELRAELARAERPDSTAGDALREEKAAVEAELARLQEERARLERELAALRRKAEVSFAEEQAENALLRERISDVAAEVVRLAAALDGPGSPIETILAEGEAHASPAPNGHPAKGDCAGAAKRYRDSMSLADRIRALQARASRPSSPPS
jgi:chromosome segregation ATPase